MESVEAHLEQLETAGERVYDALFDTDSVNSLLDVLTVLVDGFGNLVESMGGGGNMLLALIPVLTRVFSGNIAESITKTVVNLEGAKNKADILKTALENLNSIKG
jgi:hypothetical protein